VNISTIQKRRFLNNLYKSFYADGAKPKDQQVRKAFNEYFTINKPGFPLRMSFDLLRARPNVDVDILNEIMAHSIFNIDVIYDSIFENNDQLLGIVTSLNKKMDNLKSKRSQLEAKIDDLLFINSNSDGFFYSFTEIFSSLNNIDLDLSSAYVNIDKKNVEIPSLNSENFNNLKVNNIVSASPSGTLSVNSSLVQNSLNFEDFSNVFDGLTDTYWSLDHTVNSISSVAASFQIPLNNNLVVSKIQGVVYTTSPLNILMRAVYSDSTKASEIRTVDSRSDYGTFSFNLPASNYRSIEIIMYKIEPDAVVENSSNPFVYKFGLRELVVGSKYYDKQASLVSKPISVPSSDNKLLFIDAVSLDVSDQVIQGTDIRYYVAEDVESATSISDFNWISISPQGSESSGYPSTVSFAGSNFESKKILSSPTGTDLQLMPVDSTETNANLINPALNVYPGKTAYRVTSLDKSETYINPTLYGNIDSFKHYYVINSGTTFPERYKELTYWSNQIVGNQPNILNSLLKEQLGSIYPGVNSPSNGYLQTKILCQSDQNVVYTVNKINYNFNLAVYLNGQLIADLPKGTLTKSVDWNFVEGINNLIITYDKPYTGVASFSLMEGTNISRFGSIFVDYYNYLDPFEFANKITENDNFFTIDTVFGVKQIFSSKRIDGVSRFNYISKTTRTVNSIRYRVDFFRFSNPFSSPLLESLRIKFKHSSV
jgi:hypothetical protein